MKMLLAAFAIALASCHIQSRHAPGKEVDSKPDTSLEIYTYGLPNFDADRARQRVAKRWGFSYRAIAGCVVSAELLDSATRHNNIVEAALVKRHGPDWYTRFQQEADATYILDTVTRSIVLKHPLIAGKSRSLDSQGKGLLIEPAGTRATGPVIDALAYTYDVWEGRRAYVVLYDLRVDTAARTAIIAGTTHRLFEYLD